jgi:chromosome segregation protein
LSAQDSGIAIESLSEQQSSAQREGETAAEQLAQTAGELQQLRDRERELITLADQKRREQQEAQGRLTSAEALQQAALGLASGKVSEWLASHSLQNQPRLAQQLTVEAGWDKAVETVLGGYLEAVCVDSLDPVAAVIERFDSGSLAFFSAADAGSTAVERDGRLLDRVQGPRGIESLLGEVITADSLGDALARRHSLQIGESIITREGIWIGRDWLRVSRDKDVHAGVISREKEVRQLRIDTERAEQQRASAETELESVRELRATIEEARESHQANVNQLHRRYSEVSAQLSSLQVRAEQTANRLQQLRQQSEEFDRDVARLDEELSAARGTLETGIEQMAVLEEQRGRLEQQRDHLRQNVSLARSQAQTERASAQDVAIKVESRRSTHTSVLAGLERMRTQRGQLQVRQEELNRQVTESDAPIETLSATLEAALGRRVIVDQELATARNSLQSAENAMRELDEQRMEKETGVEEARQVLDDAKLAAQELRVRRETLQEQFAATQFELQAVLEGLVAEANVATWDQTLKEVTEKIERLGSVNLAAIDEFKEQSERKEYLDRQFADLTEALDTLESAIRKIDRETRSRFQDTFDKVNAGLKDRFPRLFGGGHAYLELDGEDVLNAGVSIMARPPGKRNSTINQLSGGEKALTAVALVFSIFELTPAPFCLLDEVDAPLDDNNVGRFCETVKEMSQRVQFIFITHNKTTMELASQLIGVTMNEPGVSRLVAVDVDEAMRMAAM